MNAPGPEVLQVKARRQQSFYDGGPTTEGDNRAAILRASQAEPAVTDQLVRVLASLDPCLQAVEEWPTQLEVVLDLLGLDREQQEIKKVQSRSAITLK